MCRPEFEEYVKHSHNERVIAISITTPGDTDVEIKNIEQTGIKSILRVKFYDSDDRDTCYPCITYNQAKEIADFVKSKNMDDYDKIIVHCDAGQSRSAGVAAAIMKFLNGSDAEIFNNFKYYPNRTCYRRVLEKLYE